MPRSDRWNLRSKRQPRGRYFAVVTIVATIATTVVAQDVREISDEQRAEVQQYMEDVAERLELTDEQAAALEPIIRNGISQRRQIMESYGIGSGERPGPQKLRRMRGEMKDLQQQTQSEVGELLSDDQMEEFLVIQKERQAQLREQMRSRMNSNVQR